MFISNKIHIVEQFPSRAHCAMVTYKGINLG